MMYVTHVYFALIIKLLSFKLLVHVLHVKDLKLIYCTFYASQKLELQLPVYPHSTVQEG